MDFSRISIVEHAAISTDDVWLIHESEAPQVPEELRGRLSTPCILAGDASLARNLLSFVRAIDQRPFISA